MYLFYVFERSLGLVWDISFPLQAAEKHAPSEEAAAADRFIAEETMGTIREIVASNDKELMPPPPSTVNKKGIIASPGLGLKDTIQASVGGYTCIQHVIQNWEVLHKGDSSIHQIRSLKKDGLWVETSNL